MISIAKIWCFEFFQFVIGANKGRALLAHELAIDDYSSVLDLGCGNGMLLDYLSAHVDYLGLDISAERVEHARKRWPQHEFRIANSIDLEREVGQRRFQLVVASGLLHHMPDDQAEVMLQRAATVLEPGGMIFLVDPVIFPGQSKLSKLLCLLDAGRWVRSMSGYRRLIPDDVRLVQQEVRGDLLRVPQSLQVMTLARECRFEMHD